MTFNFIPLRDNAIFLQNWRERMRASSFLPAVILAGIIVALILTDSIYNKDYVYDCGYSSSNTLPWANKAFYNLAVFQGIILLFFGTLSIDRMSIRERSSGTLEFHRASPTGRVDQFLGLLLGPAILEWCVFAGTFVLSLLLCLLAEIRLSTFLYFYLSLVMTTLFYHTLAVLLAVSTTQKKIVSLRRFGALQLLLLGWVLSFAVFEFKFSALYHLTWMPAFEAIAREVRMYSSYACNSSWRLDLMNSFFGLALPPLVLQAVVQASFFFFLLSGVIRQISKPDRPVFSKTQSAGIAVLAFVLFAGSAYSYWLGYEPEPYYSYYSHNSVLTNIVPSLLILTLLLGLLGALVNTPKRLQLEKGWRRVKKTGLRTLDGNDDQSSNFAWIATYVLTAAVGFFLVSFILPSGLLIKTLAFLLIISPIVAFSQALEYFQLSPHHKKIGIFWTIVAGVWIFLPILASILTRERMGDFIYYFLLAPSPFGQMEGLNEVLRSESFTRYSWRGDHILQLSIALIVNVALATVAGLLAASERKKVELSVMGTSSEK